MTKSIRVQKKEKINYILNTKNFSKIFINSTLNLKVRGGYYESNE